VTEQQQQQHTHKQQVNKQTNKQTTNPYGNPTTRYCETFAGRKERKCWQSAHIWLEALLEHQRQAQYSTPLMGSK
jgi:hypothetical protein